MKSQKDLSSQIKMASENLRIQPSANAWAQMENRLDKAAPQPKNGKVVRFRPRFLLSLAASLALIVGAVYFFQNHEIGDLASDKFRPTFLETLTGAEDCNPYCAVMKNRKELPADYAKGLGR